MKKWIMSANPNYFDHAMALHELGFIDWKQTRRFSVGDIVFIYVARPDAQIRYKTVVIRIDLGGEEIIDLSKYWIRKKYVPDTMKKYMRLKLVQEYNIPLLHYTYLRENGMRYAPQSPCIVNEQLEAYLKEFEVI